MLTPVLSLIKLQNPPEEPGVGGSFVVLSEIRYIYSKAELRNVYRVFHLMDDI